MSTSYRYVSSKSVVLISLGVCFMTAVFDYFFHFETQHALYENALLVVSILAFVLCVFITLGLYLGVKLKDTIGKLTDNIDIKKLPDFGGGSADISTAMEGVSSIAEGIGGFLFAIVAALVFILIGWYFVLVAWFLMIFFAAMLYWIFFRALRLVFKHSIDCKGNLIASLKYSVTYTFFYTSWIYGIMFVLHYIST